MRNRPKQLFLGIISSIYILSGCGSQNPQSQLELTAEKPKLNCPGAAQSALGLYKTKHDLSALIQTIDLNPENCIWSSIKKNVTSKQFNVKGIAYGGTAEVSIGAGIFAGRELVIMKTTNNKAVQIAIVEYTGPSASVGLPGISVTQSIIHGRCEKGIYSYEGNFTGAAVTAVNDQYGYKGFFARSYCDSRTMVRGSTTPILAINTADYSLASDVILLSEARSKPFIDYLNKYSKK